MRATEVRGDSSSRTAGAPSRGRSAAAPAGQARARTGTATGSSTASTPAATRGRGRQQQELPPAGPTTEPDEFETKLIIEIHQMPPGRSGFKTIKTIEETLRSKAGQLGGTRKEIPDRLDRLETMGIFKRESRSRGTGQVSTGDLVLEHPVVVRVTADLPAPKAAPPRTAREPRRLRPATGATDEVAAGADEADGEGAEAQAGEAQAAGDQTPSTDDAEPVQTGEVADPEAAHAATEAAVTSVAAGEPPESPAPTPAEEPATPFRWVSAPAAESGAEDSPGTEAEAAEDPGTDEASAEKAPAKPARRKPAARTSKPRTAKTKAEDAEPGAEGPEAEASEADTDKEPSPA
ncbi:MAG: hypothetical protein QOE92_1405, partial [Chloroflexota bacterium]|nr:hypothetical protein [Chloroflexota bacterium]